MSGKEILEQVMQLEPAERFAMVDAILRLIDEPDTDIDEVWNKEAQKRLKAYREGKLQGLPMEEVLP